MSGELVDPQWPDCKRCEGCGEVASTGGQPWKYWKDTSPATARLITPLPCPDCKGDGRLKPFTAYCIDLETVLEKVGAGGTVELNADELRRMIERGKAEILDARKR